MRNAHGGVTGDSPDAAGEFASDPFVRLALEHLERRIQRGERVLTEATTPEELAQLVVHEELAEVAHEFARDMLRHPGRTVRPYRSFDKGFRRRLQNTWGEGLERLWLLWIIAQEARNRFDEQERSRAVRENDLLFDALTRLHSSASHIAYEILTLLEAGLASGAHARWRALHEVAVTAFFIGEHGAASAERFLLHSQAAAYQSALEHNRHAARLGEDPFSDTELDRFKATRDALRGRFGPCYPRDNGWALIDLGIPCNPTHVRNPRCRASFAQLEAHVDLEHWRPYYRMASHPIHATSRSVFWTLGGPDDANLRMVGPSDGGLADPGQALAMSLVQITAACVLMRATPERLVVLQALRDIERGAVDQLMKSHELEMRRRASGTRGWRLRDALLRRRPR